MEYVLIHSDLNSSHLYNRAVKGFAQGPRLVLGFEFTTIWLEVQYLDHWATTAILDNRTIRAEQKSWVLNHKLDLMVQ